MKDQPTKTIQLRMTKRQLEDYGQSKYIRKTWKRVGTAGFAMFAGGIAGNFFSAFVAWVFTIAFLGLAIWWAFKSYAEGKKFWKMIKDTPEPVQL